MGKVPLYGRSLRWAVMLTVLWVSPFDVDYTMYRGTSLIRPPPPQDPTVALSLGTYGDPGVCVFLMNEVPL